MGDYTEFYHYTAEVEPFLYDFIRHRCGTLGVAVHAVNGMPDHVHLVCTVPPLLSVSEFMGKVKGASVWIINRKAQQERDLQMCLYWQQNFGGLTLGENVLPRAVRYVKNQKRRHAAGRLSVKLERCDDGYDSSAPPSGSARLPGPPLRGGRGYCPRSPALQGWGRRLT